MDIRVACAEMERGECSDVDANRGSGVDISEASRLCLHHGKRIYDVGLPYLRFIWFSGALTDNWFFLSILDFFLPCFAVFIPVLCHNYTSPSMT